MTYSGIETRRFAQLLEWGADDAELRRFFSDTRLQLIQKGAKVQNPPHGKAARIRMLAHGLPPAADRIVQKWFNEHLQMIDPKPARDVLDELRLYEEAGESPPEDDAKRLARSCLVHLFSSDPPAELMSFLRPSQPEPAIEPPETNDTAGPVADAQIPDVISEALGRALIALAEGRDPDEFLSSLPAATAAFLTGIQAVRSDRDDDGKVAVESLDHQPIARTLLVEYAARKASARSSGTPVGLQMVNFARPDASFSFDFDRDEVLAVCTRDHPETRVFLHPSAIRASDGTWIDLSSKAYRERLFYHSGDLIAFSGGKDIPRQPKRGEIGIWRVEENKGLSTSHRTNFHIASEKTFVYEVRDVPFDSASHDAVREYIKDVVGERRTATTPLLFLLRDKLIVGCPAGKDLSRDEGFDAGLPCWQTLSAFCFEGRNFVAGPLPPSALYECEALASSLRKIFAGDYWDTDKPTKALTRKLQDLIASGKPKLSLDRAARLRAELTTIEEHEGALSALLDEIMRDPRIGARIDSQVQARVDLLVEQKEQLRNDVQQLEKKRNELLELRRKAENEQKAIAPAIVKSIREAFDRARANAVETLGEVAVFKTLMDELFEKPAQSPVQRAASAYSRPSELRTNASIVRSASACGLSIKEILRAIGLAPKAVRAIEATGFMARECGLMLVFDGIAGRIAAEAWLCEAETRGTVLECGFGEIDDLPIRSALSDAPEVLAILDANLSPFDVYARPLVDALLRRLSGVQDQQVATWVVMSIADGTAALPLPAVAHSISLRVYLDRAPVFMDESAAEAWFEEIEESEESSEWFSRLWKPARTKLLNYMKALPLEEVALILAALGVTQANHEP